MKTNTLVTVGYDIQKSRPGDPPWGNPYKTPVYRIKETGEIVPNKVKRGFRRDLTPTNSSEQLNKKGEK